MRNAIINRNTGETQIRIGLELDGKGTADLCGGTGIGFFDHMLNAFARHGLLRTRVLSLAARSKKRSVTRPVSGATDTSYFPWMKRSFSAPSICAAVPTLSWTLKTEKMVSAHP